MIPGLSGYTAKIIGVANTPEELNYFEPQEQALPEFSRIVLEIPLDPSTDMLAAAQAVEASCVSYSIPCWLEYPGTHTFVEGNILYVAYLKSNPWVQFLVPALLLLAIIAPIIMWFVSPEFRETMELMAVGLVLLMMMPIMVKMIPKKEPSRPKPKLPPIEERLETRLDNLGRRIAKVEGLFMTSIPNAVSAAGAVIPDLSRMARAVKEAPVSGYEKAKEAKRVGELTRKLEQYESNLTPSQLEKLAEARKIVDELRTEYP